jgi:hypothetical protein
VLFNAPAGTSEFSGLWAFHLRPLDFILAATALPLSAIKLTRDREGIHRKKSRADHRQNIRPLQRYQNPSAAEGHSDVSCFKTEYGYAVTAAAWLSTEGNWLSRAGEIWANGRDRDLN